MHEKKQSRWMIILAILLAGLIATLFWHLSQTQATAAANIIILILTALNGLLVLILLFIIVRSLIKLYIDRKNKTQGFRIKTKLVLGVLPLSLIPAAMMYFFASQILSRTLQKLSIDANIATVIEEAYELNNTTIQQMNELYRNAAVPFAELQLDPDKDKYQDLLSHYQLSGVEFYPDSETQSFYYAKNIEPEKLDRIIQTRRSSVEQVHDLYDDGYSIWRFPFPSTNGKLVFVKAQESPFTERWAFLSDSYSYLNHAKRKRERVSDTFKTTLLIITLAVVFGGIWLGNAFSRSLMRSLTILIHGTDQVAKGNFDTIISLQTGDELEDLGESFNSMIGQLKENREELQNKAVDLQTVNMQLTEQFEYTETLLKEVNAGILSCRLDGTIRTCNPAARNLITYQPEHIENFKDHQHHLPLYNLWMKYNRHGLKPITEQLEWFRHDQMLQVAMTLAPIKSKGDIFGSIIVLEDLTPLLNAQKLAAWREVARRVAHEIKNPLTPLQLSIQRIYRKSQNDAPDLKEVIQSGYETISSEINLLTQLVSEFSNYAKLPAPVKERFDLVSLLRNSLESYQPVFEQVKLNLETNLDELNIHADPSQMRQILNNLIGNAASASQHGDRINLSLTVANDLAILQFQDEGKGIPDDEKRKIFIPYYSKAPKGTGLGLAIVQRIAYDHGWQISVSDNHPKGTVFTLQIPL